MRKGKRKPISFTLDPETISYVLRTRADRSASDRVNEMLKRAMVAERYELLEREAAEFFASDPGAEREERKAFQKATLRSIGRD